MLSWLGWGSRDDDEPTLLMSLWGLWPKNKQGGDHEISGENQVIDSVANENKTIMSELSQSDECQKCLASADDVRSLFSDYRTRIVEKIKYAEELSHKEIFAIGDCVNKIVSNVRSYIEETKQTFETNLSGQHESMANYLRGAQTGMAAQDVAVNEALQLSENIGKAGYSINRLAKAARMLAINAGIEASRHGEGAQAFGIIADQMSKLSTEIAATNSLVSEAATSISRQLPIIKDQAKKQQSELKKFMHDMQEYSEVTEKTLLSTGESSNTRIEAILDLAYSSLSHLQFQDPMVQDIQKIEHLMMQLRDEISVAMGAPLDQDAAIFVESVGEGLDPSSTKAPGQNSGDVNLF